ncbi:hypothetical protein EDB81DRAFT_798070 [Dactylonectria macrodidyma]|uniref:Uncharacterized protein n=1 Tax=Dactylonectria macrodidyma TaxID=307937 RepID=A0A9P9J014_9HYPO|nr:hypothetical protein EDB81DRAFT_798070 [Dactylonectria macrodidyma]
MLTIGGYFPNNPKCDFGKVWGVHNVDLGNQIKHDFSVWVSYNTTLVGYKVPQYVTSVIGGTKDGGATNTTPDAGFADHDISILLGMKAAFPTRTSANDGRNDPATAKPSFSQSATAKPSLTQSALIGIAVGGAVVLLAFLIGLWLLLRKHKRKANAHSVAPTEPIVPPPPTPLSSSPCHWRPSPANLPS